MSQAKDHDGRLITEAELRRDGARPIERGSLAGGWRFPDGTTGRFKESEELRHVMRRLAPGQGLSLNFMSDSHDRGFTRAR
jgi:hypothetical protein